MAARQLERGDRGSVPASSTFAEMFRILFECEASGRDATLRTPANCWTKKSVSELVEALHETDNDER